MLQKLVKPQMEQHIRGIGKSEISEAFPKASITWMVVWTLFFFFFKEEDYVPFSKNQTRIDNNKQNANKSK